MKDHWTLGIASPLSGARDDEWREGVASRCHRSRRRPTSPRPQVAPAAVSTAGLNIHEETFSREKRVKLGSSYRMEDLSLHAAMLMMANSEGAGRRGNFVRADEMALHSPTDDLGGRTGG
jgi:hypothetical protein